MVDNNISNKEPLDTNIVRLTAGLVEWMEAEIIKLNKYLPYKVSFSEIKLFNALRGKEKSISQLARNLGISRQAVHKTIHKLENMGYLELIAKQNNKKDRIIKITNKGKTVKKQGVEHLIAVEEKLSWSMGERNLKFMKIIISENLKKIQ
tara:strand:+ start:296 stop:745 length:450 start_codon:yes stop_codon:yes gene_type:complete